jgi:DNA repair protein RecN (Recombination protein N)
MLKSLYAKNYALIDEINVQFHHGLNIITGETGAGKSILLGALGALLGDRLSKDVIRSGAEKVIVEGIFHATESIEIAELLQAHDLGTNDSEIIVRREINISGKNRCFINDTPVSLDILASLGDILVDLHGQHQHQLLLQISRHIHYLDDFAHLAEQRARLKESYECLVSLSKELNDLLNREEELKKSKDYLQFQLDEISAVDPQPDEEDVLKDEERILRNAELLYERTGALFQQIYEGEGAVSEIMGNAVNDLADLAQIDKSFIDLRSQCEQAKIAIDEIAKALQGYCSSIDFDTNRLEAIRQRLAVLAGLKKKYGGTIAAILEQKSKAALELDLIENLEGEIERLNGRMEEERVTLRQLSLDVSKIRRVAAQELNGKVVAELERLGMPNADFQIRQDFKTAGPQSQYVVIDDQPVQVSPNGIDQVEFLISANPGEDLKPLVKVASGGEISRVMLALKSLLAEADKVPVLIFDEIDIGISGRIAQAVGKSLRKLAQSHQVICITHLPQIASMAHHHYLVEKTASENETFTSIRELPESERTEQIARLFGGETVTEAHLASASELIKEAVAAFTAN